MRSFPSQFEQVFGSNPLEPIHSRLLERCHNCLEVHEALSIRPEQFLLWTLRNLGRDEYVHSTERLLRLSMGTKYIHYLPLLFLAFLPLF